ncbi:hypothetical protein HanIR_Chr05g0237211 [Helianthus annuus]|nr:hypothetical protein HanIR_Chr05g0237211 [Helianthus annuus]
MTQYKSSESILCLKKRPSYHLRGHDTVMLGRYCCINKIVFPAKYLFPARFVFPEGLSGRCWGGGCLRGELWMWWWVEGDGGGGLKV